MTARPPAPVYRWGDADVRLFSRWSTRGRPEDFGPVAEVQQHGATAVYTPNHGRWSRSKASLPDFATNGYAVHPRSRNEGPEQDRREHADLEHGLGQVALARRIATAAHAGQVDKNGDPYIDHPRRVAARVDDLIGQAVAWLHDVIEDTPVRPGALRKAGVDREIVDAVLLLTRRPESAATYYEAIRADRTAREVKLADIADNTDPERTARLDPATRERLENKYRDAERALRVQKEQS